MCVCMATHSHGGECSVSLWALIFLVWSGIWNIAFVCLQLSETCLEKWSCVVMKETRMCHVQVSACWWLFPNLTVTCCFLVKQTKKMNSVISSIFLRWVLCCVVVYICVHAHLCIIMCVYMFEKVNIHVYVLYYVCMCSYKYFYMCIYMHM